MRTKLSKSNDDLWRDIEAHRCSKRQEQTRFGRLTLPCEKTDGAFDVGQISC